MREFATFCKILILELFEALEMFFHLKTVNNCKLSSQNIRKTINISKQSFLQLDVIVMKWLHAKAIKALRWPSGCCCRSLPLPG